MCVFIDWSSSGPSSPLVSYSIACLFLYLILLLMYKDHHKTPILIITSVKGDGLSFILLRWHRRKKTAYHQIVLRMYPKSVLITSNVLFVTMCSGNQSLVNHVKHLSVQHVSIDGSSTIRINVLIDANHTRSENVLHLLLNYLLNYKLVVSINQLVAKKSLLNNHILDPILLFLLIGRLVWSAGQTWDRMWL
jgi:hypothetical protein